MCVCVCGSSHLTTPSLVRIVKSWLVPAPPEDSEDEEEEVGDGAESESEDEVDEEAEAVAPGKHKHTHTYTYTHTSTHIFTLTYVLILIYSHTAALPPTLEWVLADGTFPCAIAKLHRLCFGEDSAVIAAYAKEMQYTEVSFSPWLQGKRDFSYLIPKSSLVKANHAVEHQRYTVRSRSAYVIDVETETPEVPYGKDFMTMVQFQLTEVDAKSTRLLVTASVHFHKSVMMRSIIAKSARSGMAKTYQCFFSCVRRGIALKRGGGKEALEGAQDQAPQQATEEAANSRSWLSFSVSPRVIIIMQVCGCVGM